MGLAGSPSDGHAEPQQRLAGADRVIPGDRWAHILPGAGGASPPTAVPIGRLHALGDAGLLVGRGLCQASVTLLTGPVALAPRRRSVAAALLELPGADPPRGAPPACWLRP